MKCTTPDPIGIPDTRRGHPQTTKRRHSRAGQRKIRSANEAKRNEPCGKDMREAKPPNWPARAGGFAHAPYSAAAASRAAAMVVSMTWSVWARLGNMAS